MSNFCKNGITTLAFIINFVPFFVAAQNKHSERRGELYFSWGYNTEWYTHSNVQIVQPELGNNYTFKNIRGQEHATSNATTAKLCS